MNKNFKFYAISATIALLIHFSLRFIPAEFYKLIQPYLLAFYFAAISFYLYLKTKQLQLVNYLKLVAYYIALYIIISFIELILGIPHPYLIAEIFIQIALCGTAVLIGFGLAFIKDRLTVK
ncbi:hypothetical protein FYC62_07270 [Pedobacter aquae]|uniref:Uncharacterized protein n=1 Tax=Pedobacter aquae TaxID=2605747 RepID=A0A5C0VIG2_9SPHI|nr:hypothetical protein [Pedobacter aquae]QEK51481.1 hypothetical protein FYC62_07270 [Pedobacter aquae]